MTTNQSNQWFISCNNETRNNRHWHRGND